MAEFFSDWPCAYPKLNIVGEFRTYDEDFQVRELSNRALHEAGPHVYLYIEKQGTNTHWLARQLANHAKLDLNDVGYAGLKDRHGITRQWFSLPVKNTAPDLSELFKRDEFTLITQGYYPVKLKRGSHGGNNFKIVIRNITGDIDKLNQRLELIRQRGVPNYFGSQRFGRQYDNVTQALSFFNTGKRPRNRQKSSMYISAARSYLFNHMLAKRVNLQRWDLPMEGEVFGFAGSLRGFKQEGSDQEYQRYREQDIHPTCALWGKGESVSEQGLQEVEQQAVNEYPDLADGLVKQGLKQERRACRLLLPDLFWQWQDEQTLVLQFNLASGYFATSVLRELGDIHEASRAELYAESE